MPDQARGLVQAANDKEQVQTMLAEIAALPITLGQVEHLLADTGYCSKGNLAACEEARIEPFIVVARDDHYPGWRERFAEPEPLAADCWSFSHQWQYSPPFQFPSPVG